jgi:hypothetical protein
MTTHSTTMPHESETLDLHAREIASLTEELLELRRSHRADLDRIHLEIEAIKLYMRESHSDFARRFPELRRRADHEIPPE